MSPRPDALGVTPYGSARTPFLVPRRLVRGERPHLTFDGDGTPGIAHPGSDLESGPGLRIPAVDSHPHLAGRCERPPFAHLELPVGLQR